MRLLLQAALRNSRHFTLALSTLLTLLFLTIANQAEICSLGLMANTGSDFFNLFGAGKKKTEVTIQDVMRKWDRIDRDHNGVISKQDASIYLAQKKESNPLDQLKHWVATRFSVEENFSLLILILVGVALFKAVSLFAARYTTQLLSIRVTRDLRQQFFEHIQSMPMSFYQEHNL